MIGLAVSQGWANTAAVVGVVIAVVGFVGACWRYAIRYGRKQEKRALEDAALKQLVDANLLDRFDGLAETMDVLQAEIRKVTSAVASLRRASKPNGKDTNEIGDQVALARDELAAISKRLDEQFGPGHSG
jgi:hypothetical protein